MHVQFGDKKTTRTTIQFNHTEAILDCLGSVIYNIVIIYKHIKSLGEKNTFNIHTIRITPTEHNITFISLMVNYPVT